MRSRSLLSSLLLAVVASLAPARGHAQDVPGHVWVPNYSAGQERARIKSGALPTTKLQRANGKGDRTILDTRGAETRLETELQTNVDLADVPKVEASLAELVNDKAKAEALLGKGYEVVRVEKEPRNMADPYYDTADLKIAKSGGSLRIRIMNGVAVVNFKPPTAERFTNGVAHRIEAGIPVTLDGSGNLSEATIKFLENPRLKDNPLREWNKFYPGVKLRSVLANQVLALSQKRAIFEVLHEGVKVNELTVDKVTSTLKVTGAQKEFGSFEGEGDHLNLVPTQAQLNHAQGTSWKGPHRGVDSLNEALAGNQATRKPGELGADASPDVAQVHHVANTLMTRFGGMAKPAGMNKYVRSLIAHGLVTEKEVVEGQARYRIGLTRQMNRAPRVRAPQAPGGPRGR